MMVVLWSFDLVLVVFILMIFDCDVEIFGVIEVGVVGYLFKDIVFEEIV